MAQQLGNLLGLIGVGELLPPHLEFWVIALSRQSWWVTGWSVLGATLAEGWFVLQRDGTRPKVSFARPL